MSDGADVYRNLFRKHLDLRTGLDAEKRKLVFKSISDRLYQLAERDPAFDLDKQLDVLGTEFSKLEADALNYLQEVPDGSAPVIATSSRDGPSHGQMSEPGQMHGPEHLPPPQAPGETPSPMKPPNRFSWLALLLAGGALLLAVSLSATCGIIIKHCHDTGWVKMDNSTTQTIRLPHGLGTVPGRLDAWFSPSAEGTPAYAMQYRWSVSESGNPINIYASADQISFDIFAGVPLRGTWDGATQSWTLHRQGYVRIIVSR
jgi:hypothetical protein